MFQAPMRQRFWPTCTYTQRSWIMAECWIELTSQPLQPCNNIMFSIYCLVLWKLCSITFAFFEVYSISKQYHYWKCYRFAVCLYKINRWQRLGFLLFVLCPQTAYCAHIHGSINDAIKHRIISVIWCLKGDVALVK